MAQESTTPEVAAAPPKELTAKEQTAKHLTDLRKSISGLEKKVEKLPSNRENSITLTKTQEATMWLGKAKGSLGITAGPYAESADPTSEKIEARVDVEDEEEEKDEKEKAPKPAAAKKEEPQSEAQQAKQMRKDLGDLEVQVRALRDEYTDNRRYQEAMQYAHKYVQEASMWQGKALEGMKDEEEDGKKKDKRGGK